jgi:NAD(P)-dependent dehydrogenase (short-subunit alcohol dehydrogenase family)
MPASVADEGQLKGAYSDLEREFGAADILVNCAGLARLGPVDSLTQKDISLANDVNMDGYFLNAGIASKKMIEKRGGSIINISSASARGASESSSLYGVAKEAQCMMAREWAADLGKHGIRVNSILCGDLFGDEGLGISSGIWSQEYFEKKAVSKGLVGKGDSRLGGKGLDPGIRKLVVSHYTGRTALGKEVTYADVVSLIILLSSDLCAKISGESIALTSGNPAAFSR